MQSLSNIIKKHNLTINEFKEKSGFDQIYLLLDYLESENISLTKNEIIDKYLELIESNEEFLKSEFLEYQINNLKNKDRVILVAAYFFDVHKKIEELEKRYQEKYQSQPITESIIQSYQKDVENYFQSNKDLQNIIKRDSEKLIISALIDDIVTRFIIDTEYRDYNLSQYLTFALLFSSLAMLGQEITSIRSGKSEDSILSVIANQTLSNNHSNNELVNKVHNLSNLVKLKELFDACLGNDYKKAKKLIEDGISPNSKESDRNTTVLMIASKKGYYKIAKLLINAGAYLDINAKDIDGNTALLYAFFNKDLINSKLIKLLINKGADINTSDNDGNNALLMAISRDDFINAKILIENGADPYITTKDGLKAIDVMKDTEEMKDLYNFYLKTQKNNKLNRALINACLQDGYDSEIIRLIEEGANVNYWDPSRKTNPLFIAVSRKNYNLVKLLLEEDADIDTQDPITGNTALMEAVKNTGYKNNKDDIEIIDLFIKNGFNSFIANNQGEYINNLIEDKNKEIKKKSEEVIDGAKESFYKIIGTIATIIGIGFFVKKSYESEKQIKEGQSKRDEENLNLSIKSFVEGINKNFSDISAKLFAKDKSIRIQSTNYKLLADLNNLLPENCKGELINTGKNKSKIHYISIELNDKSKQAIKQIISNFGWLQHLKTGLTTKTSASKNQIKNQLDDELDPKINNQYQEINYNKGLEKLDNEDNSVATLQTINLLTKEAHILANQYFKEYDKKNNKDKAELRESFSNLIKNNVNNDEIIIALLESIGIKENTLTKESKQTFINIVEKGFIERDFVNSQPINIDKSKIIKFNEHLSALSFVDYGNNFLISNAAKILEDVFLHIKDGLEQDWLSESNYFEKTHNIMLLAKSSFLNDSLKGYFIRLLMNNPDCELGYKNDAFKDKILTSLSSNATETIANVTIYGTDILLSNVKTNKKEIDFDQFPILGNLHRIKDSYSFSLLFSYIIAKSSENNFISQKILNICNYDKTLKDFIESCGNEIFQLMSLNKISLEDVVNYYKFEVNKENSEIPKFCKDDNLPKQEKYIFFDKIGDKELEYQVIFDNKIFENIRDSKNSNLLKQFTDAISKGFASETKQSGIKKLKGNFVEIKINGEERCYGKIQSNNFVIIIDQFEANKGSQQKIINELNRQKDQNPSGYNVQNQNIQQIKKNQRIALL
jgi:ankyrin repeat protein